MKLTPLPLLNDFSGSLDSFVLLTALGMLIPREWLEEDELPFQQKGDVEL